MIPFFVSIPKSIDASPLHSHIGNIGYGALRKQSDLKTPITPDVFFYFYKSTLNTNMENDEDNPIAGVRSNPFNQYSGLRSHVGQITVLAEPNTAEFWFDMLLKAGTITGSSSPFTHPYSEGLSNGYTLDFLKGRIAERYYGVQAESIECNFNKNKMELVIDVSALGSFLSRSIASVSGETVTLDTSYDPNPTKGLLNGDLITLMKADGTTLDTAITTVNSDGISVIVGDWAAAFSQGDYFFLRGQTPTYNAAFPFSWTRTEFRFGNSASLAFAAEQLRLETGSKWKISHNFENKNGAHRSGAFDPTSLVRLQPQSDLTLKTFFDLPNILQQYLSLDPNNALVIRHFSEANYELRLTFNQVRYKLDKREIDSAKIIYEELTAKPNYSTVDGQAFSVEVLNNLNN